MENRFEQSVIEHGRQSVDARKIEASGDYDPESWIDQQISSWEFYWGSTKQREPSTKNGNGSVNEGEGPEWR